MSQSSRTSGPLPPKLRVAAVTALCVIVADQVLKAWVLKALPVGATSSLVPGVLEVTHGLHAGSAFEWLSHWASLWKVASFASVAFAAFVISALLYRGFAPREFARPLALGLVLGGTLADFIDRLSYGVVVDYLHLDLFAGFRWADSNLAEIAIVVGAATLLVELLVAEGRDREQVPRRVAERDGLRLR